MEKDLAQLESGDCPHKIKDKYLYLNYYLNYFKILLLDQNVFEQIKRMCSNLVHNSLYADL